MKIKTIHLIFILFLLISTFTYFDTFYLVENYMQDSLLQSSFDIDTRIVIISIDDASLEELGRWPWPRTYHGELIKIINEGKPAAIGLDLIFSEPSQNQEEDMDLLQAVKEAGNVVIPAYGVFERVTRGEMRAINLVEPFHDLREAAIIGHINALPDTDGIVRKTLISFQYEDRRVDSFGWQLYSQYLVKRGQKPSLETLPLDKWNRLHIDFVGEPGNMEHISYHLVLNGDVPPEYFEDKIVLVGPYTVGIADDYYFTPLARQTPMYGVEIHGNIIQSLLHGNLKRRVSFKSDLFLLIVFSMLSSLLFNKLTLGRALLALIGIMVSYFIIIKEAYQRGHILPIFYPLALLVISYIIILACRYIEEMLERKRVKDVFGKYVAPEVVDKILKEGEAGLKLGGSRREITALFVDIRGFTPLSEKAQPEEVVAILNEYLSLCAESIFKFGGTLDKFIGDATMALFNAPLDLGDHPLKALQAAWAMKEGAKILEKNLEEKFGHTVKFGVGVHTGIAIIGNIGADFRMDYTAIGDTVNTAARLESNAKPGQILMSQSTYEKVKDQVEVSFLGEIKVKGKTQGIPIYELEGVLRKKEVPDEA